ncbi:MAG: type II toxin-antitoxin system VapC family toxin [Coriobacteriia bacterium]
MRVLFDTNVILDHMLEREPHVDAAEQLLSLVDSRAIDGVICATTATTIHYLVTKARGAKPAAEHLRTLLSIFDVACVDRDVLRDALDTDFADYEDAVLHQAALESGAAAIVTRNGRDFVRSTLPVFDPQELLAAVRAGSE